MTPGMGDLSLASRGLLSSWHCIPGLAVLAPPDWLLRTQAVPGLGKGS